MANPVPLKPSVPAIAGGQNILAIIPANVGEMMQLADMLAKSEMVPKNYIGKPQDIVVAMMYGMELGMPPLASLRHVAVINGKPCLYGDGQLGIAMGKGMVEAIRESVDGEGESMRATCSVKRKGMVDPTIQRFGVADAKRAGLWGKAGPWTLYPKRMMQMRARSFALRDAFPDLLLGMSAEEAADAGIGPENARDVTPAAAEVTPPASRLDAMEAAIAGEPEPDPMPQEGNEFGATQPELPREPTPEERAEAWGNKALGFLEAAPSLAAVVSFEAKNRERLEEIKGINMNVYATVAKAIADRKAALATA